ncbi:MAG: FtsW/RodA/SpoVE family cell cycle protein [Bacilli bacterium]|nr:FtsW/RodA/SpoVE family cell cycle protein [Bacilli bacterium]
MKKTFNKIDKPLLVLTIICLVFGVMMVGSASSLKAYMKYQDSYFYFKRQLMFILMGLFAAFIIIKTPIKRYRGLIHVGVLGILGALMFVLLNEKVMNGVSGWLFIGGFGIQPSEFAKTVLILYLALTFEKYMKIKYISNVRKVLPFIVPLMFMMLIFLQPDLGTMLILLGITGVIFFLVPYDRKTKFVMVMFTIVSVLLLAVVMVATGKGLTESQKERFNYKNPCSRYRKKTGYQVCNGYIAINSAPILPTNFGNSKQKYLYLPEAHTDFIFAIIIEEMGLVVGIIMLLVYFLIIWRIIMIGKRSYNLQGTIISYGVATYISLHVIINLVGVLGLLPLTGVPLPFYTYGGSFMINLLICLGLVQRVSVENKVFEQKHIVR